MQTEGEQTQITVKESVDKRSLQISTDLLNGFPIFKGYLKKRIEN